MKSTHKWNSKKIERKTSTFRLPAGTSGVLDHKADLYLNLCKESYESATSAWIAKFETPKHRRNSQR